MADENTGNQQEQEQVAPLLQSIRFEDILPWENGMGDTGLSSRLKLKRNFEKIKTWIDTSTHRFLSRLFNDIAHGHITFNQGLDTLFAVTNTLRSYDYTGEGLFDKGFGIWNETEGATGATYSHAVVDFLTVRLKAFFAQLELREISYVGGNYVFSSAGSKIYHVEYMDEQDRVIDKKTGFILGTETAGTIHHFRCWFYSDDGTTATMNKWVAGDQAQCRTFDIDAGVHENVQSRFYWRLVKAVGKSAIPTLAEGQEGYGREFQYADLSHVTGEHALNSSGSTPDASQSVIAEDFPEAGDRIVQIGNWSDQDRQGVMYLQVCGDLAFFMYEGVGTTHFEMPAPTIRISPKLGNIFKGKFYSESGTGVDTESVGGQIKNIVDLLNDVRNQVDKRFDIWFGAYTPMPQRPTDTPNYPASEWTQDNTRELHLQDIFTDTRKEAAQSTAGRAWRYEAVADENDPTTIYYLWREISDRDTIAVKEQLTDVASDGKLSGGAEKSRVYSDWMRCVDEYTKYKAQCDTDPLYAVSTEWTAYQTAFLELGKYLNGGNAITQDAQTGTYCTPKWISSDATYGIAVTTDITPATWYQKWGDYNSAITVLANALRSAAKHHVDDLASDGIISAGYEKSLLYIDWLKAMTEYNKAVADNGSYSSYTVTNNDPSVSTATLVTKFKALAKMLNGGTDMSFNSDNTISTADRPSWIAASNMQTDTVISSTPGVDTYISTWEQFYSALAELNSNRMTKLTLGVKATFINDGSSIISRVTAVEMDINDQTVNGVTTKGLKTRVSEMAVTVDGISTTVSNINTSIIPALSSAISTAQSTANGAATTADAAATWINQNKDKILLVAGLFDNNGAPTSASGLMLTGNFSSMFATAYDNTGAATSISSLSTRVDGISSTVTNNKTAADNAFSNINTALSSLQEYAEDIDEEQTASATWINQNSSKWSAVAASFNSDGTIKSNGRIALYVDDQFSNISLTADNIDFTFSNRWSVKASGHGEVMSLSTNGDLTVKGDIISGSSIGGIGVNGSGLYQWDGNDFIEAGVGFISVHNSNSNSNALSVYGGVSIRQLNGSSFSTVVDMSPCDSDGNAQIKLFRLPSYPSSGAVSGLLYKDSQGYLRIG